MTSLDATRCPVCGYPGLAGPPWTGNSPSDEICPSCGTQFGYDDAAGGDLARRRQRHRELREAWIATGPRWYSRARQPPSGWDPGAQLQAVVNEDEG